MNSTSFKINHELSHADTMFMIQFIGNKVGHFKAETHKLKPIEELQ